MIPRTSLETRILNTHPDKLDVASIIWLRLPDNQAFLAEYQERWASVIAPRQAGRAVEGSR